MSSPTLYDEHGRQVSDDEILAAADTIRAEQIHKLIQPAPEPPIYNGGQKPCLCVGLPTPTTDSHCARCGGTLLGSGWLGITIDTSRGWNV
jgi:hypothetical protein